VKGDSQTAPSQQNGYALRMEKPHQMARTHT
jgi:hypothetical protein